MSKTILIVEDDLDYQAQLDFHLQDAGYTVLAAETAAAARQLFAKGKPDLAIVDLMLEHQDDGFALCYHFKKQDAACPVILLTAVTQKTDIYFDADTAEERFWIRADVLLHKPLPFELLHREINRLMRGSALGHAASAGS